MLRVNTLEALVIASLDGVVACTSNTPVPLIGFAASCSFCPAGAHGMIFPSKPSLGFKIWGEELPRLRVVDKNSGVLRRAE
ncbi:hypothetical protein ACQKWADRAFT_288888 [Trichoderma austrokoningii]